MTRFIQFVQLAVLIIISAFIGYDLILHGISIFNDKYITIALVLAGLLEIALFVIYKLIEED